jgi:dTDP-4-amino-4,6-dideoxygalactose transaminase
MTEPRIPFLDLGREGQRLLDDGILADIERVIREGRFLFGSNALAVERRLAEEYFDGRPVVLVGSGTDAICLALKALGIGPGDKVAVPSISAIPTAVAVKMTGAEPVYLDVDSGLTMDPACLEKAIERDSGITAVLPVHLFGNPAQIGKIRLICAKHGVLLVEDCAQSFGAKVPAGNPLGTLGAAGALSFYPTKNLGCFGDGGAIVCPDHHMAADIMELRFYGQKDRGRRLGRRWGMNSRMDEIQCAVLRKKLDRLPEDLDRRLVMKAKYDEALKGMPQVWTPCWREGCMPHLYPVLSPNKKALAGALAGRGIDTATHYPFHLREAVEGTPGAGRGSEAKRWVGQILSVPFNPWMTDEEADRVLEALSEAAEEVKS